MKTMKKLVTPLLALVLALGFAACGAGGGYYPRGSDYDENWPDADQHYNTGNEYEQITENPWLPAANYPKSTFQMDANTAAYSNLRRYINEGRRIDPNQVRIEELVNYFDYGYEEPTGGDPMTVNGALAECPWNEESLLLTVGVKAKEVEFSERRNNLVFLMDISGSMNGPTKMPLMQSAFTLLSENLNDDDYVSIVTYAGSDKTVLDGARGSERMRIQNAVEDLVAGGATAGAQGMQTAFELAQRYFIDDGNNRIILATDGDFNVGVSSVGGLEKFIEDRRDLKIGLTVLGFGYGDLKDSKLEAIAGKAYDGNYGYVDSITQARRLLVDKIGGTLVTVARDVKAQVEFNPEKVEKYRLLGYENKLMTEEEWDDPKAISGNVGAGHCVTAVYEIQLKEQAGAGAFNGFVRASVRYKDADGGDEEEEIFDVVEAVNAYPNDAQRFIAAVCEAALIMRRSEYMGTARIENVISRLRDIDTLGDDLYKAEFLELMEKYAEQIG